nr:M-phase inducer phosphatase-like isoform X2 [Osmia lignaria]
MLSRITELEENSHEQSGEEASMVLVSPISGIVGLMNSTLLSVDSLKGGDDKEAEPYQGAARRGPTKHNNYEGLFKNAFKIKNTPENTVKSRPRARRFLGMASRRILSPEPVSPSIDKENNSPCNAASPQKFAGAKKIRYPLEDCDPNSQDSGYGTSYPEKEEKPRQTFRFVEPLAVAPRRMSIECRSPMKSPVPCSPQRTRIARSSLFRSVSSGYESMDDGFNDLIDVETLDDATQLPNGISTLLCGDIVGSSTITDTGLTSLLDDASPFNVGSSNPTTPEFARTDCTKNFRRSLSLQNDRPEVRKRPSLSKVRSCLFRSPSGNSPTVNSPFEDNRSAMFRRRRFGGDYNVLSDYRRENTNNDYESPSSVKAFKRPDPPIDESPTLAKRSRRSSGCNFFDIVRNMDADEMVVSNSRPVILQRSVSMTAPSTVTVADIEMGMEIEITRNGETTDSEKHAHIKSAIHRSTTDTDLTGDFSKPCVLPLATGHHDDLKSISTNTLAALIRGEFNDRIGSFQIVDCRYPYEYDAGHIDGALNLYSKDLIERILLDPLTNTPKIQPDSNKRNILVFHCEFSWERGPNLSRFLRNLDRQRNKEHYPALHYPEVYLLHGGYEQFYREQKGLCSPQGYRPMRHPDHEADLRQFRNKSKSWQGERSRITGSVTRSNLKRLGF